MATGAPFGPWKPGTAAGAHRLARHAADAAVVEGVAHVLPAARRLRGRRTCSRSRRPAAPSHPSSASYLPPAFGVRPPRPASSAAALGRNSCLPRPRRSPRRASVPRLTGEGRVRSDRLFRLWNIVGACGGRSFVKPGRVGASGRADRAVRLSAMRKGGPPAPRQARPNGPGLGGHLSPWHFTLLLALRHRAKVHLNFFFDCRLTPMSARRGERRGSMPAVGAKTAGMNPAARRVSMGGWTRGHGTPSPAGALGDDECTTRRTHLGRSK